MSWFGFLTGEGSVSNFLTLPTIFKFGMQSDEFVDCDVRTTYTNILTDAMDRTHGLDKKFHPSLWDSCLQSEASVGLISLLSDAMADNGELFLVYKSEVLRKATPDEEKQIRIDYAKTAKSSVGVYISFKKYRRTKMLKIFSAMEYCVLAALHKLVNLAKAIQIKIDKLRESVSLLDASAAAAQARAMAENLAAGRDIVTDAKDLIECASPDISPTEKAIAFFDAKRAYILALPLSYISGAQTPGIGSTGEADMRAVERGLKQYWTSILYPVIKALWQKETEFKSQDFREYGTAFEALKTFQVAAESIVSVKSQRAIAWRMFDLDAEDEEKYLKEEGSWEIEKEPEQEVDANGNPIPAPGAPPPNGAKKAGPPTGNPKANG